MEIIRTIYLHPEPSLRRPILRSTSLVNSGSTRWGNLNLPFKNLKVGIALCKDVNILRVEC